MSAIVWEEVEAGRYRTVSRGRVVLCYRTPGRKRGWTIEVDGVPDEGLTGCSPRMGGTWGAVRPLFEGMVRGAQQDARTT